MKNILYKLRPAAGLSGFLHFLFNIMLPILVLILVRLNFAYLAVALVLLSKWRIVAVRPKYWLPNIRGNLIDIFVGLSIVAFMAGTTQLVTQLFWMTIYIVWLVWLKPKSNPVAVMVQALIAQAVTLVAFYRAFPDSSLLISIIVTWLICYSVARHFLGAFDEPMTRAITHIWAWFGACMAWILGHWVVEYMFLPQIALILTALGYGLATLYYLDKNQKLKDSVRRQLLVVMGIILLIIIVFSDWQDKTIG